MLVIETGGGGQEGEGRVTDPRTVTTHVNMRVTRRVRHGEYCSKSLTSTLIQLLSYLAASR